MTTTTETDLAQLRELFEMWLESRPSFRTTVEVQAAWEGWKANTAVAAMLAAHESCAQMTCGFTSDEDAYESNVCEGIWTAGINAPHRGHGTWDDQIECHGESKEAAEQLRDAVLAALQAQPASVADGFPDAKPFVEIEDTWVGDVSSVQEHSYNEGWNACREAMLDVARKTAKENM